MEKGFFCFHICLFACFFSVCDLLFVSLKKDSGIDFSDRLSFIRFKCDFTIMKIVCLEPKIFAGTVESRLQLVEEHAVPSVSACGADLVVFPEFFSTGFYRDFNDPESDENGRTLSWMKSLSVSTGAAVAGSVPVCIGGSVSGTVVNRFYFVDGNRVMHYDKRHVFLGAESEYFSCGDRRVVVDFRGWRILLLLCYDLRFPVWSRVVDGDYDMILCPAQWPASRIEVPVKLAAARAIENQAYCVFCNWSADIRGIECGGHTCAYAPDGKDLTASVREDEHVRSLCFELSLGEVSELRNSFPVSGNADRFTLGR